MFSSRREHYRRSSEAKGGPQIIPTNADVSGTRSVSARNRGRLLASPHLAKERPDPKPPLDAVMSQAQLEKKVADYLRKSKALDDYWQRPITAEQLQAEMDRMATHTKRPEMLHDLFAALGNDPFVIAECLARPALAERLPLSWYAYDKRLHGELRQRAESELSAHPNVEQMKQLSGSYSEVELLKSDRGKVETRHRSQRGITLNSREWDKTVHKLAAVFDQLRSRLLNGRDRSLTGRRDLAETYQAVPVGMLSRLQKDETRFYATAILTKNADHVRLATVSWLKMPAESCLSARYHHTAVWTNNEMIL